MRNEGEPGTRTESGGQVWSAMALTRRCVTYRPDSVDCQGTENNPLYHHRPMIRSQRDSYARDDNQKVGRDE